MTQIHGLETIELGSTAWRQIINFNLEQLDSNRIYNIDSTNLPTSGFKAKRFFYTNDTHKLYYDNGLSLVELIGGSGGGSGAVDSVNGKVGVVNLTTEDIEELTNLYYTDERVRVYLNNNNFFNIEAIEQNYTNYLTNNNYIKDQIGTIIDLGSF